ncbi:MAG: tetratricopeptide repeat protein, partial [Thermoguttaceae bacterium]
GNAANSRFYADMLLSVGNQQGGIEALRRAVRIDPTDQTSMSSLANALNISGQSDEAIDILWRLFERAEDLSSKMLMVSRLTTIYQQERKFNLLAERLKQNVNDPAGKREATYCLAQAYASADDYHTARQTLESLLTDSDEAKANDTLLLGQLSKIAESQGDITTAIRYQEMLCDQTKLAADNDRLMSLYYSSGEKERAASLFMQILFEKSDLADQIDAIDKMLAQEDYTSAKLILDRIEPKNPDNWEVLYRQMQTQYWTKDFDAAEQTLNGLLGMNLSDDTLSAKKEKAKSASLSTGPGASGSTSRMRYPAGYSPWSFNPNNSYYQYNYMYAILGNLTSGQNFNIEIYAALMSTIFREKLQLEQYYFNRGTSVSGSPPKPLFVPDTFGDLRTAAFAWRLKLDLDKDLPEKNKDESSQNKLNQDESEIYADTIVFDTLPEEVENSETETPDTVASDTTAPATETSASATNELDKSGVVLELVNKRIEEFRALYPEDSNDNATLKNRLNLECLITFFLETQKNMNNINQDGVY